MPGRRLRARARDPWPPTASRRPALGCGRGPTWSRRRWPRTALPNSPASSSCIERRMTTGRCAAFAQQAGRLNAVDSRQVQVQQHQPRLQLFGQLERLLTRRRLPHHHKSPRRVHDSHQGMHERFLVIDQHHTNPMHVPPTSCLDRARALGCATGGRPYVPGGYPPRTRAGAGNGSGGLREPPSRPAETLDESGEVLELCATVVDRGVYRTRLIGTTARAPRRAQVPATRYRTE